MTSQRGSPSVSAVASFFLLVLLVLGTAVGPSVQAEEPKPQSLALTGRSPEPMRPLSQPIDMNAGGQLFAILLNDGSFENGPPPASAWTEVTNTACEWIGDWTTAWGAAPYHGSNDFWAGGYCGGSPSTDSVSQSVTLSSGAPALSFWYIAYRVDPDDPTPDDFAYVSVDGTEVWHLDMTAANNTYPNWINAAVDLSAYAGQTVNLAFGNVSVGTATGNVRFDYIEINDADFGDAPDPTFPTLLPNNGARHALDGATFLGATVDGDPDGQPTAQANGDDLDGNNDADGVIFTGPLFPGGAATVDVLASVPGLLNAWIDLNRNGSWADAGEQIFVDLRLAPGLNQLTFPVPASAAIAPTYARFRFSSAAGLGYDGLAPDGEVEDYMIPIEGSHLGDFVWEDLNANGIQDAGEPGMPGVRVDLYNAGGTYIDARTTDSSGQYLFLDLPPGGYYVEFVPPPGWLFSPQDQGSDDTRDSDADAVTGQTAVIALPPVTFYGDLDAGLFGPATLGDLVWEDANVNGLQDPGETGIAGVTVNQYQCGGALVDTTTSDASGSYIFTGTVPGAYFVEFVLPGGYAFTLPDQGADDTIDSDADPATGQTMCTTLLSGQTDPDWDAGMYGLVSLGDLVWYDTDRDGIQELGEPGLPDIAVDLHDNGTCADAPIASTVTDGLGQFSFAGLAVDTYCLQFGAIPAGWLISPQDQGADDTVDSDADATTGQITSINLAASDVDEDMGLYTEGSTGDTVWCDANQDTLFDPGEGVAGVTVNLHSDPDCDTVSDALLASMDTVGDGQYLFTGLAVGAPGGPAACYVVEVDVADMGTCNNSFTPTEFPAQLDAGSPDDLDNDFGFTTANPPTVLSVSPMNGTTDVAIGAQIIITFSQAISPTSFGFGITPDPGGWTATWNGAGTAATLDHQPFAYHTAYTATVTAAESVAGLPIATPYEWGFVTADQRVFLPLIMR